MSTQQRLESIDENKIDQSKIDTTHHSLIHDHPRGTRSKSTPFSIHSSSRSSSSSPVRLIRSKSTGHVSSNNNNNNNKNNIIVRYDNFHGPTLTRAKSLLENIYIPARRIEFGDNEYDVDSAIDIMGMGKYQWYLFFIMGIISLSYSAEVMLLAFLLPIFQNEFNVSGLQSTLVPLASIIGAFIGAFVLSQLSDQFGRRWIIIIGVILTAIFGIISAFASNIYTESIFRFFVGFFMKIGVVAITLLAEFLPTINRGKILMAFGIFWTIGLMISVSLAWICLTYFNWRIYIKLTTIPLWIGAIGALFIDESPHFLITKSAFSNNINDNIYYYKKCKQILLKISIKNNTSLPDGELIRPKLMEKSGGKKCIHFDSQQFINLTSLLLLLIYCSYQSGYYGILFVSVRYFAKLDSIFHLHHEMYWEMMLIAFSEIPGIIIGLFIIDKGRKFTINISFFLFAISTYLLVFIDIEFNRPFGILLLFLSRMWNVLSGLSLGVYFLEYYTTNVRASALGFAVSISMIFKMISILVAESLHFMYSMYIFGSLAIFAFIASLLLPIDNKQSWSLPDG